MNVKALVNKVEGLYLLPEVYQQLSWLLDGNECNIIELEELISYDPVMSARLFGIANGPLFSGQPVESISAAISRVGINRLRRVLISTTATHVFANVGAEMVEMDNYWHHSVSCALAGEFLARRLKCEAPQRLFIAGLMHDIGQLVIYQTIPDLAIQVLRKAGELESYRYRMEQEIIGFTHAEVGQELLSRWQLPLMIRKAVEFHHEPQLAGEYGVEASIVHIATAVANSAEPSWKMGGEGHDVARQINPFAWRITGLSPSIIDETVSKVKMESINVLCAVAPASAVIF